MTLIQECSISSHDHHALEALLRLSNKKEEESSEGGDHEEARLSGISKKETVPPIQQNGCKKRQLSLSSSNVVESSSHADLTKAATRMSPGSSLSIAVEDDSRTHSISKYKRAKLESTTSQDNAPEYNSSTAAAAHGKATPTDHDVLCGRGGKIPFHSGNVYFRELVAKYRPAYRQATKSEKPEVSRAIIRLIQANGGRFLKQVSSSGQQQQQQQVEPPTWVVIPDSAALDKTSQQMRTIFRDEIEECKSFKAKMELAQVYSSSGFPTRSSSFIAQPQASTINTSNTPAFLEELLLLHQQQLTSTRPRLLSSATASSQPAMSLQAEDSMRASLADKHHQRAVSVDATSESEEMSSNSSLQSIPPGEIGVATYDDADILCGRGGAMTKHLGNKKYRQLIDQFRASYFKAKKQDKPQVSRRVVRSIRSQGGRFLKQKTDGLWYEVGDHVAFEKTSQQIRDKGTLQKLVSKELKKVQHTTEEMLLARQRQMLKDQQREMYIRQQSSILAAQRRLADEQAAALHSASALISSSAALPFHLSFLPTTARRVSLLEHRSTAELLREAFDGSAAGAFLHRCDGGYNPCHRVSLSSIDQIDPQYLRERLSTSKLPPLAMTTDDAALCRALFARQHVNLMNNGI